MQVVACNMATYMVSVFRYCQAFLIKKKNTQNSNTTATKKKNSNRASRGEKVSLIMFIYYSKHLKYLNTKTDSNSGQLEEVCEDMGGTRLYCC